MNKSMYKGTKKISHLYINLLKNEKTHELVPYYIYFWLRPNIYDLKVHFKF